MPKILETTVYTLAELKELDPKAYEKAIDKIKEDANSDGFYIQLLSQDIGEWFKSGPGKLSEGESPFDDGDRYEWDYDHRNVVYTFNVYMAEYMKRNKLIGKNRTLYNWLISTGDYRVGGKVGSYINRNTPHAPLPEEVDEDIISDIQQLWQNPKLEAKLTEQVKVVLDHLAGTAKEVADYLMKWIVADIDYRYSDEFAIEEAEAQEYTFTKGGRIFC